MLSTPSISPRFPLIRPRLAFALCALCGLITATAHANVTPAILFTDNMVLQRARPLPIWGKAKPGETVTVTLGENGATATAKPDGSWSVTLPPQKAGTGLTLTIAGENMLAYRNIAVGEVWVCAGQSNMEFPLEKTRNADVELAAASLPDVRLFVVPNAISDVPRTDFKGVASWKVCDPVSARRFSAVGYFFGRELHRRLNVPVGLIAADWGGTPAEAWTSRPALEASPALRPLFGEWEAHIAAYPAKKIVYEADLAKWQAESDKAKAEGKSAPRKPSEPFGPNSPSRPASLFNGMIAPLKPYAIKGVIWYQGESNADTEDRATQYRTLFPALIRDWRAQWNQGDFPFLFVQLANWLGVQQKPVENDAWALLREAQVSALSLPHTGMATAIDLADADHPNDIHPKNKQDVGLRLALVALATEYGEKVVYSGPTFDRMEIKNGEARLHFRHADGGLKSRNGEPLRGFAIAGADGVWRWADAAIQGDTITLTNAEVPTPTAVRYNWARNPIGALVNGAGLPAVPFRTDTPTAP